MPFHGTESYVATEDLKVAVNAAIVLERPLLVKGEPGTGKTVLAEEIAKALGAPLVSIVPLSGVNSELVLTFAWEITWYQYRVLPEAGQPIRLADRGADLSEIEAAFTEWNARLDDDGRIVPNAAR